MGRGPTELYRKLYAHFTGTAGSLRELHGKFNGNSTEILRYYRKCMGNSGKLFKIQETYGNATASLLGLYKNFTGTVREPGGKPTRTVWEHYADP